MCCGADLQRQHSDVCTLLENDAQALPIRGIVLGVSAQPDRKNDSKGSDADPRIRGITLFGINEETPPRMTSPAIPGLSVTIWPFDHPNRGVALLGVCINHRGSMIANTRNSQPIAYRTRGPRHIIDGTFSLRAVSHRY
jgi:hypothetical protein